MRISRAWLSDYIDFDDLSVEEFVTLVTTKVAEVDGVESVGSALAAARIAFIESVRPHPERQQLSIATLNLGQSKTEVVCGAPNVTANARAIYLPPGGRLASGQFVEERSFGGVTSRGVLVSEAELGITADHSGIYLFSADSPAKPGEAVARLLGGVDTILVIDNKSLTHRPDLWSHLGFAREIAAVLQRPLKQNPDRWADDRAEGTELLSNLGSGKGRFTIKIEKGAPCRRFTALQFSGVGPSAAPLWMRRRLFAVGAGIRNLLVDLSNYVMHDIGQPNHAYDIDLLRGDLIKVRLARNGEEFRALDGVERKLTAEDLVIADEEGAVALGGVIGGERSAINERTNALLLESANFDPVAVRLVAKRHQLRTDASNRFEKSLSPFAPPLALHRFAQLLSECQPRARISAAAARILLSG